MLNLEDLKKISDDRAFIVEKSKGKKVLEIGCINHSVEGIKSQQKLGTWLFDYLHKYASAATGIDIDKKAIEYLNKHGYDVRFGDAQNFDLKEKFDVIIASKLIDHLLNLDGFLKSCKQHLSPSGKIIISDDNVLCLPQLFVWYLKRNLGKPDDDITVKIIPEHFRLFAKRYGLKVNKIHYVAGTGKSRLHNLFKFVARITPKMLVYEPLFYPYYIIELDPQ